MSRESFEGPVRIGALVFQAVVCGLAMVGAMAGPAAAESAGPPVDTILEDMVIQKERFRPEALHGLGLDGLKAVLDEVLPDTAAPRRLDVPAENVDRLIAALGSASFRAREEAFDELVKIGPGAREQLAAATRNADPEISWRADRILRKFELRKLEDKGRYVQAFALYVRGIDDEPRLEELARRTVQAAGAGPPNGGRHQILSYSLRTVMQSKNERLVEQFRPLLAHQEPQVAIFAAHAMFSGLSPDFCPAIFIDALKSNRDEVALAAIHYSQQYREHAKAVELKQLLIGMLDRPDPMFKLQAAAVLWQGFQHAPALDMLLEQASQAADKNVRYQAISRLSPIYNRDKPLEEKVLKVFDLLLKDDDENTRRIALSVLGNYPGEQVAQRLIPLMADKDQGIAEEARRRLADQTDKDMLRRLLAAAAKDHASEDVRKAAADLLKQVGEK